VGLVLVALLLAATLLEPGRLEAREVWMEETEAVA
jgi:hypothetical protein